MVKEGIFSVKEFAGFSRTTSETLRHYDRIGLLKPVERTESGHRYYSPAQLELVNVIRTFQDIGLKLDEIGVLIDKRDPENLYSTFDRQMQRIEDRINELRQSKHLLMTIYENYNKGLTADEDSFRIEYFDSDKIILGGKNDYSHGKDDYDALNAFYNEIHDRYPDLNLNYPVWGAFSKDRILKFPAEYSQVRRDEYQKRQRSRAEPWWEWRG